ncbi:MAG TPA: transglycosylase domain-containing protein [Gaiellaceae bacterium]|nr:transglycosylase domain-containing protein [Gaiellaceae bacterium]
MPGGVPDDVLLLAAAHRRLRRHRRRHTRRWLLVPATALIVVAAVIAAAAFGGAALLSSTCSLSQIKPLQLSQNTFVYASDGSLLGSIPSNENRQWLTLGQMSRWLPAATIAVEDRRFYQHGALDYRGIVRAAFDDLTSLSLSQGGSTITQQLVRTLYLGSSKRTLSRKLQEACLAIRLQRDWSKQRILTGYLNDVYYGSHAFGVEAAAETYFSRHAGAVDLPQAAMIAGLPRAPSTFDPFVSPQLALQRRNQVLQAMLTARSITPSAYAWAVKTPLGLVPGGVYSKIKEPPFFGFVQDQLLSAVGANRVGAGGLRVRTTLDSRLQSLAAGSIRSVLRTPTDPAAALVAIDPGSGAVRAMVSYLPSGAPLQFNLATQSHRQAGSSFKPFVLATALGQGISPYSSWNGPPELVIDDPRCYTNGQPWDVHNYADESAGTMNLLDATANSVNTIYAQVSVTVGPDNVVTMAHKLGIESPLQPVCSITLGTQGVSPLEMTDAYATFAARGIHHPAEAIQRVRTAAGKTIESLHWNGTRAIPQNDADMVTYALEGVIQHGTGTAAGLDRPAAGKTGTAENYDDAWFCGYVPQLATCVWIGYPNGERPLLNVEGVPAMFGGSLPAEIWHDFMTGALANKPVRDFPQPSFTPYDQYPQAPPTSYGTTSTG